MDLEPLPVADLRVPPPPPRSRLYPLAPLGRRTAMVESSTGYLLRLAAAHCLQTRLLLKHELAPRLGWPQQLSTYLAKEGHALNGVGAPAAAVCSLLEDLTGQSDLTALTLRWWREVLPTRGLLRRWRAWCPRCYHEWSATNQPVYEPLLWAIGCVQACPTHGTPLRARCPRCLVEHQPPLAPWARPGQCGRCGAWLGADPAGQSGKEGAVVAPYATRWQAGAIGELLALPAPQTPPLPRAAVQDAFQRWVERVAEGRMAALARLLGLPRNTVWLWCRGQVLPTLGQLLQVCRQLGLTPRQFLLDDDATLLVSLPSTPGTARALGRKCPTRFDGDGVHRALAAMAADGTQCSSVHAVARRLGCADRQLYGYFPDLCKVIAARSRTHLHQQGRARREALCAVVRATVLDLRAQHIEPTRRNVEALLPQPGILRDPVIRDALRAAVEENHAGSTSGNG